jgi:uncharacterized protein YcbK (DUF882 family)
MTERRSFLKKSVLLASTLGAIGTLGTPAIARAAAVLPAERKLRFYNTHTGETLNSVFWAEGDFLPEAMTEINRLLRDHRNNSVAAIDPQLLLLLERVTAQFGSSNVVHVISGYRSPETNEKLAQLSDGVAKHSLHMEGRAIDIRIPGRDLASVRKAALGLQGGGVGYYPDSQFVHLDTGRIRHW